jgi:hypothetical protein
MRYAWVGILGACSLLIGACQGGDGNGSAAGASGMGAGVGGTAAGASAVNAPPPLMTGVARNRVLSSLSRQEADQLCEALAEWAFARLDIETYERTYCVYEGINASGAVDAGMIHVDVAACRAAMSSCLAAGQIPPPSLDCDEDDFMELASCNATLGMFEDCVAGIARLPPMPYTELTCETAERVINEGIQESLNRDPMDAFPIEEIPECAAYLERCPPAQP